MIDVILLGSGATMPTPERGTSAAMLRCSGRSILFDCGESTQVAMRRAKLSPLRIDLIALTHYHGDHIFGLPGLLQTMSCLGRTEPLIITGPNGLEAALAPVLALAGAQTYEIHLLPVPGPRGFQMDTLHPAWPSGARCSAVPTIHRVPSQGYIFSLDRPPKFDPQRARALGIPVSEWAKIIQSPDTPLKLRGNPLMQNGAPLLGSALLGAERKGLRVVFSGDTQACPTLQAAAENADLLIHDATYGDSGQAEQALMYGHCTFQQAAEVAAQANVKLLWLTHFSQMMQDPTAYLMNARRLFPNTQCGFDGMSITLRFENQA